MPTAPAPAAEVLRDPGFARFWTAETVSGFGTYVTTVALQVLVVLTLDGSAADVGFVSAARWLPYVVLGLVVGALVDRRRRQPLLVVTDLGRGLLLCAIPLLAWLGGLSVPVLMAVMVAFGTLALVNDAATQSFVPRLVPRASLLAANARLDQSDAVAQTSGPAIGGALVGLLGAPVAVLVDAASYLLSAALTASIRVTETVRVPTEPPHLLREVRAGLRWVYRHRVLTPFALGTHGWFVCHSALTTVYVTYVLLGLDLGTFQLGLTLAAAGVGGLVGSLAATRVGLRWGVGRTVITSWLLSPVGWAVIVLAPDPGPGSAVPTVAVLMAGQLVCGLAMGLENANSMGYRQAVTPDALQGRMNITMRSINRAMVVVGAPLGGLLGDAVGYRPVMLGGIVGFVLLAAGLALSPYRHARHDDEAPA
ncbi:MFS transporter [Nocardioides sp. KIGAM211]|uniref:MFS transporter n=1 Tax=Nocardioides luti TaxID=2761101 RepID=A0A7X0RIR6_9ACTN|nr:MFS transporter [Nocardioides luti]MBB6629086.1 MFS transporter [Nocardioides luti]